MAFVSVDTSNIVTSGGGGLAGDFATWVYTDYATAIGAGDSWGEGDFVVTTSDKLVLRYFSTVLESSGLVPAFPVIDPTNGQPVGLLTALTRVSGYAAGTDPRSSESWTNYSSGSESTDYSITTGGGVTTYSELTSTGSVVLDSDDFVGTTQRFLAVVDSLSGSATTSEGAVALNFRHSTTGTFVSEFGVELRDSVSTSYWSGRDQVVTNIAVGTQQTVWLASERAGYSTVMGSVDTKPSNHVSVDLGSSFDPATKPNVFLRVGATGSDGDCTLSTAGVGLYEMTLSPTGSFDTYFSLANSLGASHVFKFANNLEDSIGTWYSGTLGTGVTYDTGYKWPAEGELILPYQTFGGAGRWLRTSAPTLPANSFDRSQDRSVVFIVRLLQHHPSYLQSILCGADYNVADFGHIGISAASPPRIFCAQTNATAHTISFAIEWTYNTTTPTDWAVIGLSYDHAPSPSFTLYWRQKGRGLLSGTASVSSNSVATPRFLIGSPQGSSYYAQNCEIAHFAVFDRVLTTGDIAAYYALL